jgi:hypothetical protein
MKKRIFLLISVLFLTPFLSYGMNPVQSIERSPRLALWLAKKHELIEHPTASYDLVMTAWFEPAEADSIRARHPTAKFLAGLTLTWIYDEPGWLGFLITVANNGDPNGPLQITDDMYLMFDDDGDGILDRRCSLPGWEEIYAMDPRHPGWRQLIFAFYKIVANQSQHDGVIVDMVDAYPFCDSAWSEGVQTPIDSVAWVSAQDELLSMLRDSVPAEKWILANAGRDFPSGSPFPQHVNGYLLENFIGELCLLSLEEGLASAQRAISTTNAPHIVVFSVDTDNTGIIDWPRFRSGLVASLLMDNTYFAFDYGPRDHGGVTDWWFPDYYNVVLGNPLDPYSLDNGVYSRDFEYGVIVAAEGRSDTVTFSVSHMDIATGEAGTEFIVPQGDARIFVTEVGVGEREALPISRLYQIFPNPFSSLLNIRYSLAKSCHVEITISNLAGQLVTKLVSTPKKPGSYTVQWNGKGEDGRLMSSGIYFIRLKVGDDFSQTKKLVLLSQTL